MSGTGFSLSVRDLKVTGDGGRLLLSLPALDVSPGSLVGIRGPSGAGKSTFLFAIAGMMESAKGCVRWNDVDILSLSPARRGAFRAANIGMIFQDFLLFEELSAQENAALPALFAPRPARAAIESRSAGLLARLGLKSDDRTVATFSGGERQRVGVARALANDGPVLLTDEPSASLDRAAADALTVDLFAEARRRGQTVMAVSHDENLLSQTDRVIEFADGELHQ